MTKLHSRIPFAAPLLTTLSLGLSVAGCGDQAGSPSEGMAGQETTLAEIDVGYGTVKFQELTAPDGSRTVGLVELAPATLQTTPVEHLFSQGPLTALETFQAIAPDREAPALLAEAHAAEAAALGRPDATVRQAAFDKDVRTGMAVSVSVCEGFIYQDPGTFADWANKLGYTNVSGDYWLNVGTVAGDWSYATTQNVTMGVCNNSDGPISVRYSYDNPKDAYGWIYSSIITVRPNDAMRYYNFNQATNYPCPDGLCARAATRYGVWGSSPAGKSMHLRTATYKLTPQPL